MKELTEEQILRRAKLAREAREAHQKKISKPKWLLAKQPTKMGQFRDFEMKQKEAKG